MTAGMTTAGEIEGEGAGKEVGRQRENAASR
jgi:hypothetical protein